MTCYFNSLACRTFAPLAFPTKIGARKLKLLSNSPRVWTRAIRLPKNY